ncbi:hypothetical protein [Thermicanus aegyptius]|uniref:hypothetical protein n=1 Tax=Thermicanus aegyptius TaxID=94009 RepID=UPI001FDF2027|nr:hypothetical protein [Thermicanus aegyptius]
MKLTMKTRREVIHALAEQYKRAKTRHEKSAILDNAVKMLGCHRKHAIRALTNPPALTPAKSKRKRPLAYQEAMPVSDNGQEFLNAHLKTFCASNNIRFTRSRPYRKNDNAHVEQKNGFLVRQLVGYERYDRPEQVEWLNSIYALHDRYFNGCLPTRKLIGKERRGARVKKKFDTAKTSAQRLIESGVLTPEQTQRLQAYRTSQDPLALRNQLEAMLSQPVTSPSAARPVEAV